MSPSSGEYIEVLDAGPTRLSGVAGRALAPEVGFAGVMRAMESEERSIFQGYAGKYVDTGALEASLTQGSAAGSIRRLIPGRVAFGTSVFYGRFQGTQGPGSHRPPSAILKATQAEATLAAKTLLEYILHGGRP